MAVGIEGISFYTPGYSLDMVDLANARGEEPDKFTIGIGQSVQTVIPNFEDVVTMGVNAASKLLKSDADRAAVEMLLFASESGVDNSKSGAMFAKDQLGLRDSIRAIEMKQACYAGTFALMQAKDFVTLHPDKKVLVIASDIARYGLKTPGEVTQGGGAVAMLISTDPKVAVINDDSVYESKDEKDFWRPIDSDIALVDGHLSTDIYKEMFMDLWNAYKKNTGLHLPDFKGFAFHLPYTKMGKKALEQILDEVTSTKQAYFMEQLAASQFYNRYVGNLYTGSVYLSLMSLLKEAKGYQAGDRVGVFSFGSGAEAELFSLTLTQGYEDVLAEQDVQGMLDARMKLSVTEYEKVFESQKLDSSDDSETEGVALAAEGKLAAGQCYFAGWKDHYRLYKTAK
ncbi:hydroxymethylglutaryl-CoA synthase [Fructobacillus sp. M2-14]|uniref:Hydroxymethylglutaryl-CoA synthase n=1 Tax=Fructobacillus broussonetiae TaxID=2713173 RepID=A0ABS5QYM6_9LACO|nr:hydroxymethylglutaryl-CoA synthase [Fructobacillus broussonetiae]MBS9338250.1 hydroxymethylglutaryl-CoA synthase [Fructobacillus broussonetiae]